MVAAIKALRSHVVGRPVADIIADLGDFSAALIDDSQLRWLGPEKGVMHMAIGAVVNAAWDLAAKMAGKPLWRLLADMTPEQIVDLVDFRYLEDALTPRRGARDSARRPPGPGGADRASSSVHGYPAYTTTPGWIGYSDEKLDPAVPAGGRRTASARSSSRSAPIWTMTRAAWRWPGQPSALPSASRSTRTSAGASRRRSARSTPSRPWDPYWVEEPTSPDEILGLAAIRDAVAPVKIAAGEHVANRVIFKQLLQAGAADFLTIDACRVAGVNENVAILLLAAKFGIPVCPHAGGVGLCEMVQHLAMFDFVAVSATTADRVLEYVDHLHEHFTDPVRVTGGRYLAPTAPGFSATLRPDSLRDYEFPHGSVWQRLGGG